MAELLAGRDWDYVVGSIHFLGDGALDYDKYDVWTRASSPDEVWRTYFEMARGAGAPGQFDVLAHPDLVKHWGAERPRPSATRATSTRSRWRASPSRGIAVEVSTAGLRKPVGEIYPDRAFLEMVVDAGNPIALSSDAHVPDQLGHAYDQALELLDDVGVGELCVFERRERRLEPIGAT